MYHFSDTFIISKPPCTFKFFVKNLERIGIIMATIRKRGNSYQIRVSCGSDIHGKAITESMTWKPDSNMTERQIQKELNKIVVQFEEKVKKGTFTKSDRKIKLHEYCDIYLEMQKKTLSPTTYYVYHSIIKNYVVPALGHLKLVEITPLHLQKFIFALSEQKSDKGKTLSPATIKVYYAVVQSMFQFACKMGFLENNPSTVNNLQFPKTSPAHTDILDEKNIAVMLEYLENENIMWKTLIHLALCTGCRRGELAGLQWSDILWEKKQIQISKSVYFIKSEKNIKRPKNNTSNRVIVIPDYMIVLLKKYKVWQMEQTLQTQISNMHNMLFTDKKGNYLSPQYITLWFQNFLKRNGMQHIKFHALRHTSATVLLKNGTDIKTVSSRLGHSNLSTTNRYVHALLDADIAAAETLEQVLNLEKRTTMGQIL